jgi:hypothetical protein
LNQRQEVGRMTMMIDKKEMENKYRRKKGRG